jgi:hypothetical protein
MVVGVLHGSFPLDIAKREQMLYREETGVSTETKTKK